MISEDLRSLDADTLWENALLCLVHASCNCIDNIGRELYAIRLFQVLLLFIIPYSTYSSGNVSWITWFASVSGERAMCAVARRQSDGWDLSIISAFMCVYAR